jgi:hypothetical protein
VHLHFLTIQHTLKKLKTSKEIRVNKNRSFAKKSVTHNAMGGTKKQQKYVYHEPKFWLGIIVITVTIGAGCYFVALVIF